jgi:chloride channel protein, CIC family
MTSVLMIFEMTHDYAVIVPLMIANLASLFISSRLQKQPIYEALAHQDGIHLPDLKSRSGFGQRKVFQAMRNVTESLTAQLRVLDILPVVNRANVHKLEGVVTLRDVLDSYGVDSIGSA